MYTPKIYRIEDSVIIDEFIRQNGFATLVSSSEPWPLATHIPLDLQINEEGKKVLWGHVSKGNPHWKKFEENPYILAIFMSNIHSYISSSWYGKPGVPTWNYMSVHVSGKASLLSDDKLWESLKRLTDKYEKSSEQPVSLDKLPEKVQRKMNGVAGFEIEIEGMECSFKLSQNRNKNDLKNIISKLRLHGDDTSRLMAEVMNEIVLSKRIETDEYTAD